MRPYTRRRAWRSCRINGLPNENLPLSMPLRTLLPFTGRERPISSFGVKGLSLFVANLFETAANNSLAIKGVTYKAGQVKNEDLMTYTLDFNVTGKYAAVKSFLADLGRMHEILTVDNIALAHSKTSEDAPDAVSLRVQLTLYLRMVE